MADMTVEKKGNNLVITIPMQQNPTESSTGKTLCIASSRGNQPQALQVAGKTVYVGVNAYIKANK